jgi:hypothetical protein
MQETKKEESFPEGVEFLRLMRGIENGCETTSLETVSARDTDAERIEGLGRVLSLLYQLACCHWGCHGKEHALEYLVGRVCTSAQSAIRLMGFGYYDEALALIRNIAEIGNLLYLFFSDTAHLRRWLDAPESERQREYSPIKVRIALEKLGAVIPTDQAQYAWLSEVATHVTPQTLPGAHNLENQPILGAVHQPKGLTKVLHALTWAVCAVGGPVAHLAMVDRSHAERLNEETIALIKKL